MIGHRLLWLVAGHQQPATKFEPSTYTVPMRIEPLGDLAVILRDLDASPAATARAIVKANLAEITDIVPCAETVGVYFRKPVSTADIEAACACAESMDYLPRELRVPICYELGEDLERVAGELGLTPQRLIGLHTSARYTCFAIGFCPGFAYLGPLTEALKGVPRMASPRTRTAPGSLGMTGDQTAVYPLPRPGGWPIIGITPMVLVDEADDYFPIEVGDVVQFESIDAAEFTRLKGRRL